MCNKIKTYNFYEIILINEAKVLVDKIGLFVMVLKFANHLVTTVFRNNTNLIHLPVRKVPIYHVLVLHNVYYLS